MRRIVKYNVNTTQVADLGAMSLTGGNALVYRNLAVTMANNASGTQGFAFAFTSKLSQTKDYDKLASLFSHYRIDRVNVRLLPCLPSTATVEMFRNVADGAAAASQIPKGYGTCNPKMWFIKDTDDSDTATFDTLSEVLCTGNTTETKILTDKEIKISYRPIVRLTDLVSAAEDEMGTGRTVDDVKKGPWIDITYPEVPFHGLKFFLENIDTLGNSDQVVSVFHLEVDYVISFKNAK